VCGESSTVTAPEPAHSFRLLDEAFEEGARTLKRWNVSSADELRDISAEKLTSEMEYHHHISIDGYVLKETPYESYAKGNHNEEAQFQGYNREEGAPFILFSQANLKNYEQKVREAFARPDTCALSCLQRCRGKTQQGGSQYDLSVRVRSLLLGKAGTGDFMVQEFGDRIVYTSAPYRQAYEILDKMYGFGK